MPPGAVWPAIVMLLATVTTLVRLMMPPTSKTTNRFEALSASRSEPAPLSLRLVT
jgi:hypothetical protein